jgi:hypothetical protein
MCNIIFTSIFCAFAQNYCRTIFVRMTSCAWSSSTTSSSPDPTTESSRLVHIRGSPAKKIGVTELDKFAVFLENQCNDHFFIKSSIFSRKRQLFGQNVKNYFNIGPRCGRNCFFFLNQCNDNFVTKKI